MKVKLLLVRFQHDFKTFFELNIASTQKLYRLKQLNLKKGNF